MRRRGEPKSRQVKNARNGETITALDPAADVVGGEIGGQMVDARHGHKPVGRHVMPTVGERCRHVCRIDTRHAVNGRLEHVTVSAAEAIGQAKIGASTPQREADHRVGRDTVVEAGGEAIGARRQIVASRQSTACHVGLAAIGRGPNRPAAWIGHGLDGRLVNRGLINQRRPRQRSLRREAAVVCERIGHQRQERVHRLNPCLSGAGTGLPLKLRQRVRQI